MVVSAILLTALAPITGALFGASYGTSIRIGYEIIFPALFGDLINKQKNQKGTPSQEEGAKRTIQALHTMFTATGGASAMEFGIEQGIEMAKKKTESQDVQDMIDLNLGLSNRQINKRGKAFQFQDPITDEETFQDVVDFEITGDVGDFHNQTNAQITKFFKQFKTRFNFDPAFQLLLKEKGNTSFTQLIWKLRPKAGDTTQQAIAKTTTPGSIVQKIATMWNKMTAEFIKYNKNVNNKNIPGVLASKKLLFKLMKTWNVFVFINKHANLQVDTLASINARKLVKKVT